VKPRVLRRRRPPVITAEMCSRKPCRFSNAHRETTQLLEVLDRPAASAETVILPHLGVVPLSSMHDFGESCASVNFALRAPAVEIEKWDRADTWPSASARRYRPRAGGSESGMPAT